MNEKDFLKKIYERRRKSLYYGTRFHSNIAIKIIEYGKYRDYPYVIKSMGTHPCAYVGLQKGHYFFNFNEEDINRYDDYVVRVHGGFTYKSQGKWFNKLFCDGIDYVWLGWDYAHSGDYLEGNYWRYNKNTRKWSFSEVFDEVKNVIIQLIGVDAST